MKNKDKKVTSISTYQPKKKDKTADTTVISDKNRRQRKTWKERMQSIRKFVTENKFITFMILCFIIMIIISACNAAKTVGSPMDASRREAVLSETAQLQEEIQRLNIFKGTIEKKELETLDTFNIQHIEDLSKTEDNVEGFDFDKTTQYQVLLDHDGKHYEIRTDKKKASQLKKGQQKLWLTRPVDDSPVIKEIVTTDAQQKRYDKMKSGIQDDKKSYIRRAEKLDEKRKSLLKRAKALGMDK